MVFLAPLLLVTKYFFILKFLILSSFAIADLLILFISQSTALRWMPIKGKQGLRFLLFVSILWLLGTHYDSFSIPILSVFLMVDIYFLKERANIVQP